jgi:hypothetical protein
VNEEPESPISQPESPELDSDIKIKQDETMKHVLAVIKHLEAEGLSHDDIVAMIADRLPSRIGNKTAALSWARKKEIVSTVLRYARVWSLK